MTYYRCPKCGHEWVPVNLAWSEWPRCPHCKLPRGIPVDEDDNTTTPRMVGEEE